MRVWYDSPMTDITDDEMRGKGIDRIVRDAADFLLLDHEELDDEEDEDLVELYLDEDPAIRADLTARAERVARVFEQDAGYVENLIIVAIWKMREESQD